MTPGTALVRHEAASGVCQGSGEPGEWGVSATELPTTFTYTGQREAAEIGLKYYVARWYDSYLNHFTQPDTIIADPYNPMDWNRYAYVHYNPINYVDPSGHMVDEEGSYNPWKKTVRTDDGIIELSNNNETTAYLPKMPTSTPTPPTPSPTETLLPRQVTNTPAPPGVIPVPRPTLSPEDLTHEFTFPKAYSLFIDFDGGVIGLGYVAGFEILITTTGGVYLFQNVGESVGLDAGIVADIGIGFYYEDDIQNIQGVDYNINISASKGLAGVDLAASDNSFAVAWVPGAHVGIGGYVGDKTLIAILRDR